MTRGFITIATGKEMYYQLAQNLLLSYRLFCDSPYPFAIMCDRENQYTALFDQTVLFQPGAHPYFDKFEMLRCAPYDETIFIDADCLAYDDLNQFWDYFADADDFPTIRRTTIWEGYSVLMKSGITATASAGSRLSTAGFTSSVRVPSAMPFIRIVSSLPIITTPTTGLTSVRLTQMNRCCACPWLPMDVTPHRQTPKTTESPGKSQSLPATC